MNTIKNLVDSIFQDAITDRRYLHQNPELSKMEENTSKYVMDKLDEIGIPYKKNVGGYGVVGLIEGASEGPTIMIRADMDALPISEETDLEFKSCKENVMHACGHDVHTSNLIAVAKILNQYKSQMKGNVKLCFQPAEEGSGGAISMIEDNVLEDPFVDYVIGMHIDPSLEIGTAAIEDGPVSSYPQFFKIVFRGSGGHGSVPNVSIDPILPAVRLYEAIHSITKEICPLNPNVIQVCAFNSGTAPAIIPDVAEIKGTVRTHYIEDRELIRERIYEMTEAIAKLFRVEYEIEYWGKSTPSINDPEKTARVREVVKNVFDKGLVRSINFKLAGEDFSNYSRIRPATFLIVGCGREDGNSYALHNAKFNPDEKVLKYGAEALSKIALDYLQVDYK